MNPSFSRAWGHESNVYVKRLARARRTCFRTDILCDIGRRSRLEKPITLRTLLRICRIFSTPMCDVVRGLDRNPKRGSRPLK